MSIITQRQYYLMPVSHVRFLRSFKRLNPVVFNAEKALNSKLYFRRLTLLTHFRLRRDHEIKIQYISDCFVYKRQSSGR